MGYKLIACDMDETLLNDNHEICQRNIDVIKRARKEYGIKFVLATGRSYDLVQKQLQDLDLYDEEDEYVLSVKAPPLNESTDSSSLYDKEDEYVLSFNGGALTENSGNRILQFKGLSFNKVKELFEFGLSKDLCVHIYTKDALYIYNMFEDSRERLKNIAHIEMNDNSIDFLEDTPIGKLIYESLDMDFLMSLEKEMSNMIENQCTISYSSNRYMELNTLGVDKGQGLIDLAKILNIDIKDTIAIGDNYNDMSMLKVAGLSVAANNAIEDVKEVCDYTTEADNNEGAVAELIEKFIFNKEVVEDIDDDILYGTN